MPTLSGTIRQAGNGLSGFDVDYILTAAQAQDFKSAGYDFCILYVPRTAALAASTTTNLTNVEATAILNAGLALMVVQHTRDEGWFKPESGGQVQRNLHTMSYNFAFSLNNAAYFLLSRRDQCRVSPNPKKFRRLNSC